jgi:hypothetical protein
MVNKLAAVTSATLRNGETVYVNGKSTNQCLEPELNSQITSMYPLRGRIEIVSQMPQPD